MTDNGPCRIESRLALEFQRRVGHYLSLLVRKYVLVSAGTICLVTVVCFGCCTPDAVRVNSRLFV